MENSEIYAFVSKTLQWSHRAVLMGFYEELNHV